MWSDAPNALNPDALQICKVGDFTWHGFTAEGLLGDKFALLWIDESDGVQYQATVYYGTEGTITLEDEGLLAILGTLKAN